VRIQVSKYAFVVLGAVMALSSTGCDKNPVGGDGIKSEFVYRDPYPWPVSTAVAQGLDTAKVSAALREIRTYSFLYSFLVIRNDSLAMEYYRGFQKENDFNTYSAAKSYISALVGIAIDRGIIRSAQDKVLSYFPDFDTTRIDTRKRSWTIEHFLTMSSGIDWDEDADHSSLYTDNTNWVFTTLKLPLRSTPGTSYNYTTPNVHVLSGILTRASGMSTYDFAEKHLFTPLNTSVRYWAKDPQGVYIGGTEMAFTPRDLARFGQLYLHNGLVDNKQVLSARWIQETLVPRLSSNGTWGDLKAINYGYLWWNNYDSRDSLFMAVGFAGQFIMVVPAKNMIIVTTADGNVTTSQAGVNVNAIIAVIKKYFL
jgi:CubicO group peptidase (beta-lactamase class C family)